MDPPPSGPPHSECEPLAATLGERRKHGGHVGGAGISSLSAPAVESPTSAHPGGLPRPKALRQAAATHTSRRRGHSCCDKGRRAPHQGSHRSRSRRRNRAARRGSRLHSSARTKGSAVTESGAALRPTAGCVRRGTRARARMRGDVKLGAGGCVTYGHAQAHAKKACNLCTICAQIRSCCHPLPQRNTDAPGLQLLLLLLFLDLARRVE